MLKIARDLKIVKIKVLVESKRIKRNLSIKNLIIIKVQKKIILNNKTNVLHHVLNSRQDSKLEVRLVVMAKRKD